MVAWRNGAALLVWHWATGIRTLKKKRMNQWQQFTIDKRNQTVCFSFTCKVQKCKS